MQGSHTAMMEKFAAKSKNTDRRDEKRKSNNLRNARRNRRDYE